MSLAKAFSFQIATIIYFETPRGPGPRFTQQARQRLKKAFLEKLETTRNDDADNMLNCNCQISAAVHLTRCSNTVRTRQLNTKGALFQAPLSSSLPSGGRARRVCQASKILLDVAAHFHIQQLPQRALRGSGPNNASGK